MIQMDALSVRYSFIVPVYNVARYLPECVESLIEQNNQMMEIILVDDGSTDKSPEICDRYASDYPGMIRTIHKQNGGLSDARNTGLRKARGDYILFVDSDDYVAPAFLSQFESSDTDTKADVIFLNAVKVFPDGMTRPLGNGYARDRISGMSHEAVVTHLAALPKFPASAWDKMIKRELIEKHDLYFEKGLLSEDLDWAVRLFLAAETYDYFPCEYYYYRQARPGSITNSIDSKYIDDIVVMMKRWTVDYPKTDGAQYIEAINSFWAYEYCVMMLTYYECPVAFKQNVRNYLITYKWLLQYGKNRRIRIIYHFARIIGIAPMIFLMYILYLYRKR